MQPHAILEAVLYVADLVRSDKFYNRVFNLRKLGSDPVRHVFFQCGKSVLLLFRAEVTRHSDGRIPAHGTEGAGHLAFEILPEEIPAWRAHLQNCEVEVEREIDWPEGGHSIYFRDPDGNSLELATREVWALEEKFSNG